MRRVLPAVAVAAMAGAGWLLRYDVAAEAQVRAIVSAKGLSLRALPEGQADDHLISVLERETDPARRAAAAELLGKSTTLAATQALLRALGDAEPKVQTAAARTIGAHSARVHAALGMLTEEQLVRLLQSCPATNTLYWVYDLAIQARPDLALETSRAVLPRVGPTQVTWVVAVLARGLAPNLRPEADSSRVDPSGSRRQLVLACLSAGLDSPHETVRALYALEIAKWGGPEPSDEQVALLLAGLRNDAEFHHFFLTLGQRKSPRVEEWARKVVTGDRSLGVFWTLLAVRPTLGLECAERLAREGLANPEETVRAECQRWLDSYGPRGR